jgi:NADH-quinone oxidoreductase subunit H
MLWLSALISLLFLGGWLSPVFFLPDSYIRLIIKTLFIAFLIIKVIANYPRYRYDQLMSLG